MYRVLSREVAAISPGVDGAASGCLHAVAELGMGVEFGDRIVNDVCGTLNTAIQFSCTAARKQSPLVWQEIAISLR